MSGGGGSSLGTSQIRVSVTNLAPCSSKPEVPKNGGDCIESGDPSLSDCRDEPLQRALATVETTAAAEGADLVLLPETFACGGMDMHEMKAYADKQDSLGHPHLKQLKQVAQRLGVNIVAGFFLKEGKRYRNTAIVINRAGVLLGRYYKCYLSAEEMAHGVAPGSDVVVVDTDVGRVGLSIRFDINWPHHFASVFAKGADFCVWLSRHDGGLPLQAAAMNTRMPILTSTLDSPAKVIDCMGRVQAQSSRWKRYATYDLCIRDSQGMFHIDGNMQKMESIQRAYVGRVRILTAEEEGLWTIDCLDSQLSISEIKNKFQLVTYSEYLQHCMELRAAAIEGSTQPSTQCRSNNKVARMAISPPDGSGAASLAVHQHPFQQQLQHDGLSSHMHWAAGSGYEGDLQDAADSMYQLRRTQLPHSFSSGNLQQHHMQFDSQWYQ